MSSFNAHCKPILVSLNVCDKCTYSMLLILVVMKATKVLETVEDSTVQSMGWLKLNLSLSITV